MRLLGAAWDITGRRRAQDNADAAGHRAGLLARVAGELTEQMDADEAMARLARLVVPALADWCIVTLVDEDSGRPGSLRGVRDVASWHAQDAMRPLLEHYTATRLAATTPGGYLHQALAAPGR